MIVRALDVNGDWIFGKGRNDYLSNNAAVVQNIATRLKMFLGDCFFSLNSGIDWFNLLGNKNQDALQLAIATSILNTTGVIRIVQLSLTLDVDRLMTLTYKVDTSFETNTATVIDENAFNILLDESGDVLTTESGKPLAAG